MQFCSMLSGSTLDALAARTSLGSSSLVFSHAIILIIQFRIM